MFCPGPLAGWRAIQRERPMTSSPALVTWSSCKARIAAVVTALEPGFAARPNKPQTPEKRPSGALRLQFSAEGFIHTSQRVSPTDVAHWPLISPTACTVMFRGGTVRKVPAGAKRDLLNEPRKTSRRIQTADSPVSPQSSKQEGGRTALRRTEGLCPLLGARACDRIRIGTIPPRPRTIGRQYGREIYAS
jgi:hypothetical protein